MLLNFNQCSRLMGLLQTFAPLFSDRVWPYARDLLLGAIMAPGKRTVSSILRVLGLAGVVHFQNYHRVLNRARWSSLGAAQRLFQQLIQAFGQQGPLVIGMDETIERRWRPVPAKRSPTKPAA